MIEFKNEAEILGHIQAAGISYSLAVLLNRMVKLNWQIAASEYKAFGIEHLFLSVYAYHHGDKDNNKS